MKNFKFALFALSLSVLGASAWGQMPPIPAFHCMATGNTITGFGTINTNADISGVAPGTYTDSPVYGVDLSKVVGKVDFTVTIVDSKKVITIIKWTPN